MKILNVFLFAVCLTVLTSSLSEARKNRPIDREIFRLSESIVVDRDDQAKDVAAYHCATRLAQKIFDITMKKELPESMLGYVTHINQEKQIITFPVDNVDANLEMKLYYFWREEEDRSSPLANKKPQNILTCSVGRAICGSTTGVWFNNIDQDIIASYYAQDFDSCDPY